MVQSPSRQSIGPAGGFALLLVLCSAVLFATWKFLETNEATGQVHVAEPQARPGKPEPIFDSPDPRVIRENHEDRDPEDPTPTTTPDSGTAPPPTTSQRSNGDPLDPDAKTYEVSGQVLDQDSAKPILYFEMYLVPPGTDPEQAAKVARPQKYRNKEGAFTLRYLLEGTYDLVVRTLSHEVYVHPTPVQVPSDGDLTVRLNRGTWISGTVRDNYGKPLDQLDVHLQPKKLDPGGKMPRRRLVRSAQTGAFEFAQLPPGLYEMSVGHRNDPDATHSEFYLGEGQHLDKSFVVERQTTLKFLLANIAGKPVPRARVSLVSTNQLATRSNYSNIRGEATLPFVKPGKYTLTIKAPGYQGLVEDYFVNRGDFYLEEERVLTINER